MRIFILFLLLPGLALSQTHLRGQQFLHLEAGAYDNTLPSLTKAGMNYSLRLGIGKYTPRTRGVQFFLAFATKSTPLIDTDGNEPGIKIPINQFNAGCQYDVKLYENAMKTVLVKLPVSAFMGYESLNNDKTTYKSYTLPNQSGFQLGIGAGLEIEIYNFFIGYRQQYNLISNYRKFSAFPNVGYKIHLFQ